MAAADESYQLLAARYVRRQLRALSRQMAGAREAKDIECVHQARVASRRLRAAMRAFRDCFPPKKLKRWRKQIRRLTTDLGAARDKDVQIELVGRFLADQADAACRPGVRRLLLRLSQQREALRPKVVKGLDRVESSGVMADMKQTTKAILADLKARKVGIQSRGAFRRAERAIVRRLEKLLSYQDCLANPADKPRHHEMRILAKRLRYTMEIHSPLYEGRLDEPIQEAKNVQQMLGDIHDCDLWTEYLPAFLAEERERTEGYYGSARPFVRLAPGIERLQQDRQRCREETFDELVACWGRLSERGLWDRIVTTVMEPVTRVAKADKAARKSDQQPAEAEPAEAAAEAPDEAEPAEAAAEAPAEAEPAAQPEGPQAGESPDQPRQIPQPQPTEEGRWTPAPPAGPDTQPEAPAPADDSPAGREAE